MATNPLFHNYGKTTEQTLIEGLVIEAIRIYGMDMYYIPRRLNNYNGLYGEDDVSSFDRAYIMEVYCKSEGFGGPGVFMGKFGTEIRNELIFSVAQRTFEREITNEEVELSRPREGDLIFFGLNNKCFEIKYVDNKPFFYQVGALQLYDMTVELYEYSNEIFETGIADIDSLQLNHSINQIDFGIMTESGLTLLAQNGDYLVRETFQDIQQIFDPRADNDRIAADQTTDAVIDWTESNPFSDTPTY